MGTRGLFGFLYKGRYYMVYNQYDSYLEGLGRDLINEIQNGQLEEWIALLIKLKVIFSDSPAPTPEDIEKLAPYTVVDVGECSTHDWYCLTHKCQGSFVSVLQSGYLLSHLPHDKMGTVPVCNRWIEYIYILDFDHKQFIVHSDGEEQVFDLDHLPVW